LPEAAKDVNEPLAAIVPPIGVLFMEPPVIVALDEAKVFAVVEPFKETVPVPVLNVPVPVCVKFPVAERLVNDPAAAVVPPIGVLFIEPPVIAALDEAKLFAVTKPLAFTDKALAPLALTLKGLSAEPLAVATFSKFPMPVLDVVSVRLNKFAPPVAAP
jgi:hypothetical protein